VKRTCDAVESYQKELARIKIILKDHPKGMTVTDISREMNINRNSVAKYLDILLISGQAEMITFGPAKVFFPSRRVPMSAVLNFISDYLMVLDSELRILQINDAFLGFLRVERDAVLGQRLDRTVLPFFAQTEVRTTIKEALDGKEVTEELCSQLDEENFYFRCRLIPTTFEDGEHGVTMILTNITEKKRIEQALRGMKKKAR